MDPKEIHSGERVFASDLPAQARIALPQPVQPPDEEIEVELHQPFEQPDVALPQPVPPPDVEKPVVTIYVRKGDHAKERIISINPVPAGVEPLDLLDFGFAIDGNSATISVDAYTVVYHHRGEDARKMHGLVFPGEPSHVASIHRPTPPTGIRPEDLAVTWTLTKAVNNVEKALVVWLRALGYEVKFG